jgi:hypothetical protein
MLSVIMLSVVEPDKDKEKSFTSLSPGSGICREGIFRFQNRSGASVIKHFAAVIYDHLPLAGPFLNHSCKNYYNIGHWCQCNKTFYVCNFGVSAIGMPFQPSLAFAGKARGHLLGAPLFLLP